MTHVALRLSACLIETTRALPFGFYSLAPLPKRTWRLAPSTSNRIEVGGGMIWIRISSSSEPRRDQATDWASGAALLQLFVGTFASDRCPPGMAAPPFPAEQNRATQTLMSAHFNRIWPNYRYICMYVYSY
jgi:hypothetical protein